MSAIASQITSLTIVYSTVYSGSDQRKHLSSASLAFVRGIHQSPVNSPHKGPISQKMFPFDDVIMERLHISWDILYIEIVIIMTRYKTVTKRCYMISLNICPITGWTSGVMFVAIWCIFRWPLWKYNKSISSSENTTLLNKMWSIWVSLCISRPTVKSLI